MSEKQGVLDKCLEKAVSRKLLVFTVATAMMFVSTPLDAETWGWIAMVYIGSQGVVDVVAKYRESA